MKDDEEREATLRKSIAEAVSTMQTLTEPGKRGPRLRAIIPLDSAHAEALLERVKNRQADFLSNVVEFPDGEKMGLKTKRNLLTRNTDEFLVGMSARHVQAIQGFLLSHCNTSTERHEVLIDVLNALQSRLPPLQMRLLERAMREITPRKRRSFFIWLAPSREASIPSMAIRLAAVLAVVGTLTWGILSLQKCDGSEEPTPRVTDPALASSSSQLVSNSTARRQRPVLRSAPPVPRPPPAQGTVKVLLGTASKDVTFSLFDRARRVSTEFKPEWCSVQREGRLCRVEAEAGTYEIRFHGPDGRLRRGFDPDYVTQRLRIVAGTTVVARDPGATASARTGVLTIESNIERPSYSVRNVRGELAHLPSRGEPTCENQGSSSFLQCETQKLIPGVYSVKFGDLEGYLTPEEQSIHLRRGGLTIRALYLPTATPIADVLIDMTHPLGGAELVASGGKGATWGTLQAEHCIHGDRYCTVKLPKGSYLVRYLPVQGFHTPNDEVLHVEDAGGIHLVGVYVPRGP